jgi:hypothetical protein
MTYWRAKVERPDGNGGWITVGVFGTSATPGTGTARHIHGDTALEAAQLVLGHVWPVNLDEFLKRDDMGRWKDRFEANTGIADHRITLDVDPERLWWSSDDRPKPEPVTVTVADLRLAEVRARAAELAAAKFKLKTLQEQVKLARSDVTHYTYLTQEAAEAATRAGVAAPDVAKASRPPRQPRKKPS